MDVVRVEVVSRCSRRSPYGRAVWVRGQAPAAAARLVERTVQLINRPYAGDHQHVGGAPPRVSIGSRNTIGIAQQRLERQPAAPDQRADVSRTGGGTTGRL